MHSVHCRYPIRNTQPIKHTTFFLRYLRHTITLSIPSCFNPHGMIIIREQVSSNTVYNLTHVINTSPLTPVSPQQTPCFRFTN
jgi:hypothetical protein